MRFYRLFFLLATLLLFLSARAQSNSVGIRNGRFIQLEHTFARHIPLMIEHSMYSDKISRQYFRLHAGYRQEWLKNHLRLSGIAYWGSEHNGNYQDMGVFVSAGYDFGKKHEYLLQTTLNPHYDTGLKYKTCIGVLACLHVYRLASFCLEYTNLPEYRQSENRIRTGVRLRLTHPEWGQLSVTPLVSIPVDERYEKIRLHVDFAYLF